MNLKKLLCLLLALAMVLSLAACSDSGSDKDEDEDDEEIVDEEDREDEGDEDEDKKDDEDQKDDDEEKEEEEEEASDSIVGSWKGYIYMTAENTGLEGLETSSGLPIVFTFGEDGVATMTAYEPEIADAMAALEEDLVDYMLELLYAEMEAEGLTTEQVEELFVSEFGMTIEEYCVAAVKDMGLLESFMEITDSSSYEVNGDVLNLNGEELTFAVEGNTLTIYDSTNPEYWEELGFEFPVELERVG